MEIKWHYFPFSNKQANICVTTFLSRIATIKRHISALWSLPMFIKSTLKQQPLSRQRNMWFDHAGISSCWNCSEQGLRWSVEESGMSTYRTAPDIISTRCHLVRCITLEKYFSIINVNSTIVVEWNAFSFVCRAYFSLPVVPLPSPWGRTNQIYWYIKWMVEICGYPDVLQKTKRRCWRVHNSNRPVSGGACDFMYLWTDNKVISSNNGLCMKQNSQSGASTTITTALNSLNGE